MDEPTLESIEDYDTLKGDKKKVVWSVIIGSIIMGILFFSAYNYSQKEESTAKERVFKQVPMR